MKRAKGTFYITDNTVGDILDRMTILSDLKILQKLARQSNYKKRTLTTWELSGLLNLDARTTEASLARLAQAGYIHSANGEHSLNIDCAAFAQPLHNERATVAKRQPKKRVQNEEKNPLKEEKEEKEEKEIKKEKDGADAPLSPDGDASQPSKTQQICQQVIDAWNQNRGGLPAATLTPTRQKTLEKLIKTYTLTELVSLVGRATQFVAKNEFWQEKRFGFDNLLSKEKFVQHAESFDAQIPQTQAACSAPPPGFNPANLHFGQTIENLQGRQGVVEEVREKQVVVRVGTLNVLWPFEAIRGVV